MHNGLNDDADRNEVLEEEEEYFEDFDENDYMEEQHTNFQTFDDEENINHQPEDEEEYYLQSLQTLSQVEQRPPKVLGQNFFHIVSHIEKVPLPSPEPYYLSSNGLDKRFPLPDGEDGQNRGGRPLALSCYNIGFEISKQNQND